jgi:hypothetical protein
VFGFMGRGEACVAPAGVFGSVLVGWAAKGLLGTPKLRGGHYDLAHVAYSFRFLRAIAIDVALGLGANPQTFALAAATVRYQSCAQIAGQLQSSWQTLTATYGDLPERHQSIHAAFEHSWALLSTQEQGVFSRLSVFQGGFDDEAAAQVARSSRKALHALIDKSLVQRAGADRFGMHPLIQQYAGQKLRQLGQYEETRGRPSIISWPWPRRANRS